MAGADGVDGPFGWCVLQDTLQFGDQVVRLAGLHQDGAHPGLVGALVDVRGPVGGHRHDRDAAGPRLHPQIRREREAVTSRQRDVRDDDVGNELEGLRPGIFRRAALGDAETAASPGTRHIPRVPAGRLRRAGPAVFCARYSFKADVDGRDELGKRILTPAAADVKPGGIIVELDKFATMCRQIPCNRGRRRAGMCRQAVFEASFLLR